MKARILEAWDMELPEPSVLGKPWFLDWVLRSPAGSSKHLTAGWWALESIKEVDIESAVEYFGGMGAQAMMVEELWAPKDHIIYEYSQEAVAHLERISPVGSGIFEADSYDARWTIAMDLAVLDFGDLTAFKAFGEGPHRELLDRVVSLKPKAIVVTDIAARYLHLHRDHYDRFLGDGASTTYETYLEAFSRAFEARWGYALVKGFSDRWSTVMAFVPAYSPQVPFRGGEIVPTPSSPVGLVIS